MKRIKIVCLVVMMLLVASGAFAIENRVGETTITTGTGPVDLGGAKTGYVTLASVFSDGDTLTYLIQTQDGVFWEIGQGTFHTGTPNTLARDTVEDSSNAGALVDFGSGTKDVYNTVSAKMIDDATVSATTTTPGKIEIATSAETTTGTDTTRAVSPDGLAGSNFGFRTLSIKLTQDGGNALTTGDGKFHYFIPTPLNGMNLVGVSMGASTASTSGLPELDIYNITDSTDMLSTNLTLDANEKHSSTAVIPAVIDTNYDDVVTGDELRIDCDVAGTGTKGVQIDLIFQLP